MHPLPIGHLGVLVGDDAPVDLLGDVDEAHSAMQHDHRQPEPGAGDQRRLGYRIDVKTEFDHHADGPGPGQSRQVVVPCGGVGQCLPGGEHQLPAGQQAGKVGEVTDVHPAHGLVQRADADHLRLSRAQGGQIEDLAKRRLHLHSVRVQRLMHTCCRRTDGLAAARIEA